MKRLNDLNRLLELLVRHRIPKDRPQNIYMEIEQYNEATGFLKNLGSSATKTATVPDSNPELECIQFIYGDYTFNFISY